MNSCGGHWARSSQRAPTLTRSSLARLAMLIIVSFALMPSLGPSDAAVDGPMSKIAPELQSLYEAYRVSVQTGVPLISTDPLVPVVDGRVTIDAVASGDVDDLKLDLIALGLDHAASAGRMVSGRLPVEAIAAMAALPSLRFARAAMAINQGGGGPGIR